MNFSKQRETILQVVKEKTNHPTADEVFSGVKETLPQISLATVYRNLNLLAEHGFIRKITLANQPDRFDATLVAHEHIRCTKCGAIEDISCPKMESLEAFVAAQTDFCFVECELLLHGICANCVSQPREKEGLS